jgi:uncharacterized protein GlcG (DUF336 family)
VNLTHALDVLTRAHGFAAEIGRALAVVVVDSAGHTVAAGRMDGAPFVALSLAEEKARTSAAFRAPTAKWQDTSQPGQPYWGLTSALGGRLSVLAGGVPLEEDGRVIGAVGVSGGDATQDHGCALHAASAPQEAMEAR